MEHCSVILSSQFHSDSGQRTVFDMVTADVHRNLACLHYLTLARLGQQRLTGNIEVLADYRLNLVYGKVRLFFSHYLVCNILSQLDSDFLSGQGILPRGNSCS